MYGTPNLAYTSAKFAVRGMTKAVAAEYQANNIRVNSVHPGGILTKMVIDTVPEELRNQIAAASIPMQRFGNPDEGAPWSRSSPRTTRPTSRGPSSSPTKASWRSDPDAPHNGLASRGLTGRLGAPGRIWNRLQQSHGGVTW